MKKLVNKKELREKMNIAIDMLSSVKVTLGPKGENVIINQSFSSPFITNDGVTIASNIESDDIVVNTILELAKEASIKTLETAGDGTTTTLVLLEELYKEASSTNNIVSLCYPYAFKDGNIDKQIHYTVTDAYYYCIENNSLFIH